MRAAFLAGLLGLAAALQQPSLEELLDQMRQEDPTVRSTASLAILARWKEWTGAQVAQVQAAAATAAKPNSRLIAEVAERLEFRRSVGEKIVFFDADAEATLLRGDPLGRHRLFERLIVAWRKNEVGEESLRVLCRWAAEKNWEFEPAILDTIRQTESPLFAPVAGRFLAALEPNIRALALRCLGDLRAVDFIPRVAAAIDDPEASVQQASLLALGVLNAPAYAERAGKILKVPAIGDELAITVLEYLVKIGARAQAAQVAGLLELRERIGMRPETLRCLGDLHAAEFADRVVRFVGNEDCTIPAMYALGKMGALEHAAVIARQLKSPEKENRRQALRSLGWLRRPQDHEPVAALLTDPDENLRREAAHALLQMEGPKAAVSVQKLLSEGKWTRDWAFAELGTLGTIADEPLVLRLLTTSDPELRSGAVGLLGQARWSRAAKEVALLLTDPDSVVRDRAAFAIGRMGAVEHIDDLLGRFKEDVHVHVTYTACLAIAELADQLPAEVRPRVVEALRELERRKSIVDDERAVAGVCLFRLGEKTIPELRKVLALLRQGVAQGGSNWPEFSKAMLDGLSRLREKPAWDSFTRELTLTRPIAGLSDYASLLKEVGLEFQIPTEVPLMGELYEGSRTTPADALQILLGADLSAANSPRVWVLLEGHQVRLLRMAEALRSWERRLEEK